MFVQDVPAAHLFPAVSIPGGIVVAELFGYLCSEFKLFRVSKLEEAYNDVLPRRKRKSGLICIDSVLPRVRGSQIIQKDQVWNESQVVSQIFRI